MARSDDAENDTTTNLTVTSLLTNAGACFYELFRSGFVTIGENFEQERSEEARKRRTAGRSIQRAEHVCSKMRSSSVCIDYQVKLKTISKPVNLLCVHGHMRAVHAIYRVKL